MRNVHHSWTPKPVFLTTALPTPNPVPCFRDSVTFLYDPFYVRIAKLWTVYKRAGNSQPGDRRGCIWTGNMFYLAKRMFQKYNFKLDVYPAMYFITSDPLYV